MNIEIALDEYIEEVETWVFDVEAGEWEGKIEFQRDIDLSFKAVDRLTCSNGSGCDVYHCGLVSYLRGIDQDYDEVVCRLNELANQMVDFDSVEEFIERKTGLVLLNGPETLAGAAYAPDCFVDKYQSKNDCIVLVDADRDANTPRDIIHSIYVMSESEYTKWFDAATSDWSGHWWNDCGLAYLFHSKLPEDKRVYSKEGVE